MVFQLRYLPPVLGVIGAIVFVAVAPSFAITQGQSSIRLEAKSVTVDIGWSKDKVRRINGEPSRKSKDGNTWYYNGLTIHFKGGRVDSFPGAAG